jgi:recombination protein RecT
MSTENQKALPGTEPQTVKEIPTLVMESVATMIKANELELPDKYSYQNAVKIAWLIIVETQNSDKKPALEVCTKTSIIQAMMRMVIEGLNPAKHQCSFIVYGNKLAMQREYQGSIAIAKRHGLKSVVANAIFKNDEFVIQVDHETGLKSIVKHDQKFENIGGEVIGAYAIVTLEDGRKNVEVMSIGQIRLAWEQGKTKGDSKAHRNFPDQMAIKTVINRAVKGIINSSDDSDVVDENDEKFLDSPRVADAKHLIQSQNSKGDEIGIDDEVNDDPDPNENNDQIQEPETITMPESTPVNATPQPEKVDKKQPVSNPNAQAKPMFD